MLDAKGRDIGEPVITFCRGGRATPQQVAAARADLVRTRERLYTRLNGCPTQVEVLWDTAGEWYLSLPVSAGERGKTVT